MTMKKTILHIGMLAAAALAFFSCAKETESPSKGRTHTIVVTVDKGLDSKTAIVEDTNEASYKWTSGDEQYFHIYENGTEAQSVSMSLSNGDKTATFTALFNESQANEFVYTAKFAKASSNAGNPTIHTEQSPELASFDPSADILIASPITRSTQPDNLQFSLRRVVSINKMTLKGLEAGEVISSVEIGSDKSLGGYYLIESEGYTVSGKKLTLSYNATVPASGEFPVYFICGPADANKLHIHVVTDKNVYDRNDFNSTIDFQVGVVQRFNVNLANYGSPVSTGTSYVLVENQADLVDGATYIIVGESSKSSTLYALGQQNTNNRSGVAVVDNSRVITVDNTLKVYPIIIEEDSGNYTLKDSDSGKYLYTNQTGSNRLYSEDTVDDYAKWTISITNGVASINNVGNTSRGMLCFNPTWQNNSDSNPIFAGYGSVPANGTSDLALYIDQASLVPDTRDEAGMSWSANDASATIEDGDVINFTAPTLSNPNSVSPLTYVSTNTDVAEINVSGDEITIKAEGTTTIKAVFTGDANYKPQTVEYTLTVTDNRTPAVTIQNVTVAEFLAAAESAENWYRLTGTISNITNTTYGNFTLTDNTGSVTVYGLTATQKDSNDQSFSSLNLEEGFIVTIIAHRSSYNNNPQAGGAYHESHTAVASLSVSPTALVFNATGESKTVTATANHFSGNVTITASSSNNAQFTTSVSGTTITVTAAENNGNSSISGTITVTASDGTDTKSAEVSVTQDAPVAAASDGDTLWQEDFTGYGTTMPASATGAHVYGSGTVTYSLTNGTGGTTALKEDTAYANGTLPELLISKNNGAYTISGIPTGSATAMTLTFKSNHGDYCSVTSGTANVSVGTPSVSNGVVTTIITATSGVSSFDLTITNTNSSNTRVDDFLLVVGAPTPEITVATNAATSTSSSAGTTATLNGTITLVNGAVIGSVTEAGFYYKLTSAANYSKVTCASVSSANFTYDLTGLTKDSEYTFYAYAKYDNGSEVTGETATFTPTKLDSSDPRVFTYVFNSKSWGANESVSTGTAPGITWTSGQDGGQLTSGQGIQVTTTYSGANATSSASFSNVSKIVVTYCTNASKGAGTIKVQVGSGTEQSFSVTKPSSGGTKLKTTEFTFSPNETGAVKITAECTTNSVYVYSIAITATN